MATDLSCASATYAADENAQHKIESSSRYSNGKFYNRVPWKQPGFLSMLATGWKFLTGGEQRTPEAALPRQAVDLALFHDRTADQLNASWLGHSSLMINIDGYRILTDPVFEKSVSFFGPTRFNGEVPLNPAALDTIDLVIISHNHYDHLNKYSILLIKDRVKRFVTALGVGAQLEAWGVAPEKITELDWWEEFPVTENLTIAATPTQHFSGRSLFDRDKTLWASWVIRGPHHKIFFSGDSGYSDDFKAIGGKYGPFDMTFLECGAYNEKWHHIHMFPEETAQAHLDLKGRVLHPIHWATFNLSLHPWYEPMQRLARAADSLGITITTPVVGGNSVYPARLTQQRWWEPLAAGTSKTANSKQE